MWQPTSAAVQAASRLQDVLEELASAELRRAPIGVKTGVALGPIVEHDGDCYGDPVNVAAFIIEPVVQVFTDWELMWSKDVQARGDVNVQARGITGLREQQAAVDDLQWALQSLSAIADKVNPATGQPIVPPTAVPMLLQRMFKLRGIPTEGMFDQDYELVGTLQGGGNPAPSIMGGGIALDGRSPAAAAAIQTANNPAGIPGAPSGENA